MISDIYNEIINGILHSMILLRNKVYRGQIVVDLKGL